MKSSVGPPAFTVIAAAAATNDPHPTRSVSLCVSRAAVSAYPAALQPAHTFTTVNTDPCMVVLAVILKKLFEECAKQKIF